MNLKKNSNNGKKLHQIDILGNRSRRNGKNLRQLAKRPPLLNPPEPKPKPKPQPTPPFSFTFLTNSLLLQASTTATTT